MITWMLPSAFIILGASAIGVIALHFIARSRPLAEPLPTARFIPERGLRARTRSLALSDVLLLLVRLAAVAAIGLAVAGPIVATSSGRTHRIIVVDRSRAVANAAELRDSVRAYARAGDAIVVMDSAASRANASDLDSLRATRTRGLLSAGLIAAIRAGAELAPRSDSLELVVVSPFAREEIDAATRPIRGVWPGRVRIVPIAAVSTEPAEPPSRRVIEAPDNDDAVLAGLSLVNFTRTTSRARVLRGQMTAADTEWANAGHVVVHWPATETDASWPPRRTIDAIGGVTSSSGTLIGRFPRVWLLSGPTIARWVDGEPAAIEHSSGSGCIRDVAVLIDPESDLALRPAFRDFARAIVGSSCGGDVDAARIDSTTLSAIAGSGPLASPTAVRSEPAGPSPLTPWLLAVGALLLIVELAVRRGGAPPP